MNINATIIGQTLWFLFFIWLVVKFVWPYLQRQIAERQKTIAEGLAAAEKGQKELSQSHARSEDLVREARAKAVQIVDQAQHRANELIEQAKSAAIAEGERLMAAAQQQIELEATRAREELRRQVAALAVSAASKLVEKEIDPKTHATLLDKLAAQI